jgi:hypothetical protein
MTTMEERLCFSGPNALCDATGFFRKDECSDSPGRPLAVYGMTPLQAACFAEDCVKIARCLENRQTHFSAHSRSIFPPPLSICCLWKTTPGSGTLSNPCAGISYGSVACAEAMLLHGADPEGLADAVMERLRVGTHSTKAAAVDVEKSFWEGKKGPSEGIRPLHLALLNNNTPLVKLLLMHHASVKPLQRMALWCCCASWSIGGLAMLAVVDDEAVRSAAAMPLDDCGQTAMHIALLHYPRDEYCMPNDDICEHNDRLLHLLDMLSFYGCNVNARDNLGRTALHVAWRSGHADAAVHLIEQLHADPAIRDADGATAFGSHPSNLPSAAVLLAGLTLNTHLPASWEHLHGLVTSVLRHDPHAVMMEDAEPCTSPASTTTTALHLLCESFASLRLLYPVERIVALAEALLNHTPACVQIRDAHFLTPLFIACSAPCCAAFVDVLLKYGADPWQRCCDRKKLGQCSSQVTCLQQLLALPEPYYGVGDVALSLIGATENFDVNDLSQPYEPSKPFLDSLVVRTHPYWQSFFEVMCPPETEKEKRLREAQRFYSYATSASHSAAPLQDLVGEVSSVCFKKERQSIRSTSATASLVSPEARGASSSRDSRSMAEAPLDVTAQLPGPVQASLALYRLDELNAVKFAHRSPVTTQLTDALEADTASPLPHILQLVSAEDDGERRSVAQHSRQRDAKEEDEEEEEEEEPSLLARFLQEREAEEAFRRRCWEDAYTMEEMRRQHMRSLQFAAERHSGLQRLTDYHHQRCKDLQPRVYYVQ